jgi:hypothetical protein
LGAVGDRAVVARLARGPLGARCAVANLAVSAGAGRFNATVNAFSLRLASRAVADLAAPVGAVSHLADIAGDTVGVVRADSAVV